MTSNDLNQKRGTEEGEKIWLICTEKLPPEGEQERSQKDKGTNLVTVGCFYSDTCET